MKDRQFRMFLDQTKSEAMKKTGYALYRPLHTVSVVSRLVTVVFFPLMILSGLFFIFCFIFAFLGEALVVFELPDRFGGVWGLFGISAVAFFLVALLGFLLEMIEKKAVRKAKKKIESFPEFCADKGRFFQQDLTGAIAYGERLYYGFTNDGFKEQIYDLQGTTIGIEVFKRKGSWMIDYENAVRAGMTEDVQPFNSGVISYMEMPQKFFCTNCGEALYKKTKTEHEKTYLCPHCNKITKSR